LAKREQQAGGQGNGEHSHDFLHCYRRPREKRGAIAELAARHIAEPWAQDEKIARIAELL
jgi:hypothetical protein